MSDDATLVSGVATLRGRSQRPSGSRIATLAAPHVTAIVPLSDTAVRDTTPPAEPGTTAGVDHAPNAELGAIAAASTESTTTSRLMQTAGRAAVSFGTATRTARGALMSSPRIPLCR
jgi:hypothetical protein